MSGQLEIEGFNITREDRDDRSSALFYSTDQEDFMNGWRGENHGAVPIRLWVDGYHDAVALEDHHSDPREVLEKAIERAQEVLARLNELHANTPRVGQCMTPGSWGRCQAETGHEGEHDFPTKEQWEAERRALGRFRRVS